MYAILSTPLQKDLKAINKVLLTVGFVEDDVFEWRHLKKDELIRKLTEGRFFTLQKTTFELPVCLFDC